MNLVPIDDKRCVILIKGETNSSATIVTCQERRKFLLSLPIEIDRSLKRRNLY